VTSSEAYRGAQHRRSALSANAHREVFVVACARCRRRAPGRRLKASRAPARCSLRRATAACAEVVAHHARRTAPRTLARPRAQVLRSATAVESRDETCHRPERWACRVCVARGSRSPTPAAAPAEPLVEAAVDHRLSFVTDRDGAVNGVANAHAASPLACAAAPGPKISRATL